MVSVETYEDWLQNASESDLRTGASRWQDDDSSEGFDYRVIRARLEELVAIRAKSDSLRLKYYFDEGLHGNMGGMGAGALYKYAASGTKKLITDYIQEIANGLEDLADTAKSTLSLQEKKFFFQRAKQAFGECALMLSGAGSMGPFHLGVARALWKEDLLPRVISGSSAGAIIAAILCSHSDKALSDILDSNRLQETFKRLYTPEDGQQLTAQDIKVIIETWVPDVTFEEALQLSGRHLNVSISPSEIHQQSRTLNPVTAPNVLLKEALMASTAVPGVLPPVTLSARDHKGKRRPYVRSRKWVDGSITDDLPTARLRRIYGCNFFITSQTNPIVLWALNDPDATDHISRMISIGQSAAKEWFKAVYPFAIEATRAVYPINMMTRMWFSMLTQDYTGDVNIMPDRRFVDPTTILAKIPPIQALELVQEGERAAWPTIERIHNCTLVGRKLDKIIERIGEP